jgi:hypothetical protein
MVDGAIRSDPIARRYFRWIEYADYLSVRLFITTALLSILLLLIDREMHSWWYDALQTFFGILVIILFLIGLITRLYLTPRAEDKRRQDFLSNACNIPLIHETTVGYYNNDLIGVIPRIAGQLFENTFFTKSIVHFMVRRERKFLCAYVVIYLLIIFYRDTDLAFIAVVSQAIFSEQILSRYLRLEWFRMRTEKTFDEVYRMFQSKPDKDNLQAQTLDFLVNYETTKATAGIPLSSRLFERLNPTLSREWECIKKKLNI